MIIMFNRAVLLSLCFGCFQLYTTMTFVPFDDDSHVSPLDHVGVGNRPTDRARTHQKAGAKLIFVNYTSSPWEQHWLDHVHTYEADETICEQLLGPQKSLMHDFMTYSCTTRIHGSDWCGIDDDVKPFYYNTANRDTFELRLPGPWLDHVEIALPTPVRPTSDMKHIYSYFTYRNEQTGELVEDYIEPLVSHLRHPLAGCVGEEHMSRFTLHSNIYRVLMLSRGYILPPQHVSPHKTTFKYYDAGASSWSQGKGGPSIQFFVTFFRRHNIWFDRIFAFEANVRASQFYKSVPDNWKKFVDYRQLYVSSSRAEDSSDSPFIPALIEQSAKPEDYILFKLDIDSPHVEAGSVDDILAHASTTPIDEFFWEHHVQGNYILARGYWKQDFLRQSKSSSSSSSYPHVTLRESYEYFWKLRQHGIRAHSWV